MHLLRGVIQHYDWGTTSFIPELIGDTPTTKPCAELWFGTHPLAPSEVFIAQTWSPLADLTGELDVFGQGVVSPDASVTTGASVCRASPSRIFA